MMMEIDEDILAAPSKKQYRHTMGNGLPYGKARIRFTVEVISIG